MSNRPLMVGLGEVLWDLLPSGRVLGGAPTNFAYMATVLGSEGVVASRVGKDALGREARMLLQERGLSTAYVQEDDRYETGSAGIELDLNGQPHFTIKYPVAWDYLDWSPAWEELAGRADVVCFGSLARRSPISSVTIERFLKSLRKAALRVCDANLREPFFDVETLRRSFQHADLLKVNNQELSTISALLAFAPDDDVMLARQLLTEFDLKLVCITRGERGSLLVSRTQAVEHGGFSVKVEDVIGAGDAFTACLVHYYLRGATLQEISEHANRFGSWITTQVGATPLIQTTQLKDILNGGALS